MIMNNISKLNIVVHDEKQIHTKSPFVVHQSTSINAISICILLMYAQARRIILAHVVTALNWYDYRYLVNVSVEALSLNISL